MSISFNNPALCCLAKTCIRNQIFQKMAKRKISDYSGFNKVLNDSKNIVALTGAGVSAESGIPVFRGAGGMWRRHRATDLATPQAFRTNPALVWEFYHYRRDVAFNAEPNKAHIALAKYEKICNDEGRNFHIITQNVDGLHKRAGSENIIELHGALHKIICTKCKNIEENFDHPICESLRNRGGLNYYYIILGYDSFDFFQQQLTFGRHSIGQSNIHKNKIEGCVQEFIAQDCTYFSDPAARDMDLPMIEKKDLPKCKKCNALMRPYIIWFGENLDPNVLQKSRQLIDSCDLCLVIGTSSVVYPAAMFAPLVAERGKPVAEFNLNPEPANPEFEFHFPGSCGTTIPQAFGFDNNS